MSNFLRTIGPFDESFSDLLKSPRKFDLQALTSMKTDIRETKDAYLMDIEIPGYKKEEIKVSFADHVLSISAERNEKKEEENEEKNLIHIERSQSCNRSFRLPNNMKSEDISAKYENGILHITAKKHNDPLSTSDNIEIE